MRRNLDGWEVSERALTLLAPVLGKHTAQSELQTALADGRRKGLSVKDSLIELLTANLAPDAAESLFGPPDTGLCGRMTDEVIARARRERSGETDDWPDNRKEPNIA